MFDDWNLLFEQFVEQLEPLYPSQVAEIRTKMAFAKFIDKKMPMNSFKETVHVVGAKRVLDRDDSLFEPGSELAAQMGVDYSGASEKNREIIWMYIRQLCSIANIVAE